MVRTRKLVQRSKVKPLALTKKIRYNTYWEIQADSFTCYVHVLGKSIKIKKGIWKVPCSMVLLVQHNIPVRSYSTENTWMYFEPKGPHATLWYQMSSSKFKFWIWYVNHTLDSQE